ncbi:hypothetical protein ACFPTV_00260 [Sinirhodobacter huangdaonensis]|uniref:Uncharacterized protein n=2 Tax=Paenirhodobacter huangdaonensis TaxID=2501515 RepID=A0A443LXT7_9RHOB|nr:hypothetical protein [Sinirhodobacter huangdaonensis]RWR54064.1 hypothetical protein EOW66_05505 [Sinirhodobacter huangdaonensis]
MTPTIHQALHGYNDGHRLIASSVSLTSADARTMIVMSDLSGAGVKPEVSGYLTGYPLEGAGRYVLARTWAAPEMPRPGCVWTHSLIIENADLAALKSATGLLALFRRPEGAQKTTDYSVPKGISPGNALTRGVPLAQRERDIVNALYAKPDGVIVAEADDAEADERLLTAIWMQQWPRLRRTFGFCTLAGMDRSKKGARLDILLTPSLDRHIRSKFPDSIVPSDVGLEAALKPLLVDLEASEPTQMREFLRRTGGDVEGGRQVMLPFCRMYSSLFSGGRPDLRAAVSALASLDPFGSRQARSVRALVARRAVEEVEDLDDAVFDFVVESLEQTGGQADPAISAERIAMTLWRRSPDRFFDALSSGGAIGQGASEALLALSADELVRGLTAAPHLTHRVAARRPDVMSRAEFWLLDSVDVDLLADVDADQAERVAPALLEAGVDAAAPVIIARMQPEPLAAVLANAIGRPAFDAWLRALANRSEVAAGVLASGRIGDRAIVIRLARMSEPDGVPNDYGEDPWLIAERAARNDVSQPDEDFLSAFLVSRALGRRSRSQAELIRFAYATVYRALEQNRLPRDAERLVTERLDWGGWFAWDNCARFRETVVNAFVDRHLDPETFGRLTDDSALAISLIDEAAQSGRGRRYLAEVQRQIEDAQDKGIRARANYIAKKIK